MLLIPCPWCGERAHTEFTYLGDATVTRPEPDADEKQWYDFVYTRDNPRGRHVEWWQHSAGCRQWIKVERDTMTHEVYGSRAATQGDTD